jgi:hypothetical protein
MKISSVVDAYRPGHFVANDKCDLGYQGDDETQFVSRLPIR